MPCLVCKYFQAIEPQDHRELRETGRCQSSCGDRWNSMTAVRYVREHKKDLKGWCMFNPAPLEKHSGHVCAQIDIPEYFYNSAWGLEHREPRDHLFEWARQQHTNLMRGSWASRRNEELEEQNVELRRQLAAARKVSASRLKRLQKQKPEKPEIPEKSGQPLDPLPQYPRLVAAE
jgi:hypothetical protein